MLTARASPFPVLVLLCAFQESVPPDPLPAPEVEITRAELEHHVRFLASDELQGRGLATAGSERAARYLARALEAAGVEPAGEDGSFFQEIAVQRLEYPSAPRLLCKRESGEIVEAVYGVDFTLDMRGRARSTEWLPVRVFQGSEPLPRETRSDEAVYLGVTAIERKELLRSLGLEDLSGWGLEVEVKLGPGGSEPGSPREPPAPRVLATQEEGCEKVELRGDLRRSLEGRGIVALQLLVDEVATGLVPTNVVGRIRGAGTPERPALADEVVVLSAHYDHLGIHRPRLEKNRGPDKDLIFNGADDDASGCAALLELAQAFAAGPRPARTLLVLFTTGEERGGFGSARYLAGPAEPPERTVADLNLEMLGRPDEQLGGAGKLWLTGFERSNLGPAFQQHGLAIAPDPRPDQLFFQRSDNFAFALQGIVAQSLSSFGLHRDYHETSDEADTLDYAHLEAAARVAHGAARLLAEGLVDPAWNEGGRPSKPAERGARSDRGRREKPAGDGQAGNPPGESEDG